MKHKNSKKNSTRRRFHGFARVLVSALAACTAASSASQQLVDMDKVHWSLNSDRFGCELKLDLKRIGVLTFSHLAGQQLQLHYVPARRFPEQVHIASATPPWQTPAYSALQPMTAATGRFRLSTEQTLALLRSMDHGLWTLLQVDQQDVLVPTIRWDEVADPFRACQDQLSPLAVNQARDLTLYYKQGQRTLSEEQLETIEVLSRYLQIDSEVTRVLVDAYTDNTGSRAANIQISRERAADVAAALISSGVPSKLIEKRSHGSRYPSADNKTQEGRNLNRKVTIRVIRKNGGASL
jgi:outer membrane protein OmpA-like peptidoglycan-associated protein